MSPSSDAGCGTTSEREAGTTSGLSKLPIEPTLQRTVQRTSALDVVSRRLHSHNRRQLAVQSTLEIDRQNPAAHVRQKRSFVACARLPTGTVTPCLPWSHSTGASN